MIDHDEGHAGLEDETTGRLIVMFEEPSMDINILGSLRSLSGIEAVSIQEFSSEKGPDDDQSVFLDEIGVAVLSADPDQTRALQSDHSEKLFKLIEPERIVKALPRSDDYIAGYHHGVQDLAYRATREQEDSNARESVPNSGATQGFTDNADLTWGLQAINIGQTSSTGGGIRVAVLDTGIDLDHPDLRSRLVASQSFIAGQTVEDGNGHGTHCGGTVAGPKNPRQGPRYGVAPDAELLVGKVLSNQGTSADGVVLKGVNWALVQQADVISMSLGAPTHPGQGYSRIFEQVAHRVMSKRSLIVAAAGNESRRPGRINPVGHPANCPSLLSVAAVDDQMRIASFSNGSVNPAGGQIDLSAPGVAIRSAWRNGEYRSISGTSMATPHVAGVAALFAAESPDYRGAVLWQLLMARAARNTLSNRDVGSGLLNAAR